MSQSQELSAINNNQIIPISEDKKVFGEITIADIRTSLIGNQNRDVLLAKFSDKPIRLLDANIAGEKIKSLINLAILESGFKTENIPELIILVIKDVFSDFGHLTISEVGMAFRKGIRKEYGDYFGMSVVTFYGWLKGYNEITRVEAIKALNLIKKETPKVVSESDKRAYHITWLKSRLEDFEKHKKGELLEVYDFGSVFYNYCIKNGVGYLSDEDKQILDGMARKSVKEMHSPNNAKSTIELKSFMKIASDIQNEEILDDITRSKVETEYKRLAIPYIYDKLIANGLELKNVLNIIEKGELS